MIDLVDQLPNDPLQYAEIQNKQTLSIDGSLDGYPHAVVVAVQGLALMAAERDEMGRGENQIVLTDFDAKRARHGNALGLKSSHASR